MPGPMGGPGRPGMNAQAKAKNFKATTKKLINKHNNIKSPVTIRYILGLPVYANNDRVFLNIFKM